MSVVAIKPVPSTDDIKIEDGVPIPAGGLGRGKHGGNTDAMRKMDVGQSFVYRPRHPGVSLDMQRNNAYHIAKVGNPDRKFAVRIIEEGGQKVVRIWRTA